MEHTAYPYLNDTKIKKNISRLFLGLVLYVAVYSLAFMLFMFIDGFLCGFAGYVELVPYDTYEGIASCLVFLAGLAALLVYYGRMQENYGIFSIDLSRTWQVTAAETAENGQTNNVPPGIYGSPDAAGPDEKGKEGLLGVIFKKEGGMTPGFFFFCISVIFVSQMLAIISNYYLEAFLLNLGYTAQYAPSVAAYGNTSLFMVLYSVLFAPVIEEIVYRGFILRGLMPYGKNMAVLLSAFIFAIMHADITNLLFAFLMGLMLAVAASKYSICWAVIFHIFNNLLLGELPLLLEECISPFVFNLCVLLLTAFSFIYFFIYLTAGRKTIKESAVLGKSRIRPGYIITDRWFLVFFIYEALELAFSVTRL